MVIVRGAKTSIIGLTHTFPNARLSKRIKNGCKTMQKLFKVKKLLKWGQRERLIFNQPKIFLMGLEPTTISLAKSSSIHLG